MKKVFSSKGFTLPEVLVGMTVLLIGMLAFTSGIVLVDKQYNRIDYSRVHGELLSNLLGNIRADFNNYQVHFGLTKEEEERLLKAENLPIAWNKQGMLPAKECSACLGRLGFLIFPMPNFPGMFVVKIRILNDYNRPEVYRDYQTIVGAR